MCNIIVVSRFINTNPIYYLTERCMEVIAKKDSIIEDLKKELEEADLNFVRNLERQEEEINILVDRINQQINIMRSAANTELELLEVILT